MSDDMRSSLTRLYDAITDAAVEAPRDALHYDRDRMVRQSAELLRNLAVLWAATGVKPQRVWDEIADREGLTGAREKPLRRPLGGREKYAGVPADRD